MDAMKVDQPMHNGSRKRIKSRLKSALHPIWMATAIILKRAWGSIEPTWPAFLVSLLLLLSLFVLKRNYENWPAIWQGIYIEAWGSVVDIVLVGVVLTLFSHRLTRKREIARHQEQIDDFKKWDDVEGRLRIAGSIRRLARLGITKIDFRGITLRDFSFNQNDIDNLRGSVFNDGLWFTNFSRNNTLLDKVDFSFVDCREVVFSSHIIGGMKGIDLRFFNTDLGGATFAGATLVWNSVVPNEFDWWEQDFDAEGDPIYHQKYSPAFEGANLSSCSFKDATLHSADFRQAENVLEADFSGAKGLETCFFDEGVKEKMLAKAAQPST